MTGLYWCLAVLCAVSFVHGFTDVRDDASWFKNGERIRNKFVTGVVNGVVDSDCTDSIDSQSVQGECMSKLDCIQSGGRPGGLCSLMGSCCYIKKTCGETTSAKVSYFVNPSKWVTPCTLTVKRYSKPVCQIRLDFIEFDIAQPESKDDLAYKCKKDKFRVENYFERFQMPPLCGKNKGQHIYIHLGSPEEEIKINFDLSKGEGENNMAGKSWNIKITQLECETQTSENFLNAPSKLMALHSTLKNKKRPLSQKDLIAPPGCFQYYKKDTDIFESFNYNNGNGHYIGNHHYAICLRKSYNIVGAEYESAGHFDMGHRSETGCHPEEEEDNSHDYLRITGGWFMNETKTFRDHYCDKYFENKVTATANEPLYVGVHTDGIKWNVSEEIGFKIKYTLLTTYPD